MIMWLALAFLSAALLGLYDTSKKAALKNNAVIPVLFLNTVFSTLIFSKVIISSFSGATASFEEIGILKAHLLIMAKSCIVLTSWIFGYFGLKHLPITIVGPINATRPILVLLGSMLIFGERLNAWQWGGVILSLFSLLMLSRSSKKENINFAHNKWIWFIAAAAFTGA